MKVLITGGAGYIGSHCSRYFLEQGVDVTILDNLCEGHREAVKGGTPRGGRLRRRRPAGQTVQRNGV